MQVLSSLSGITFYAPSAGFAPTNSADVSAIASAYQVVSATATQLNAGSAYVTSINETPISAVRAGNAANASLATSAWYDGTGRFISALPDSATVSSIASSYAESAASSKMDESGMSAYVPFSAISADENSAITSINGSSIGGGVSITASYTASSTSEEIIEGETAVVTSTSTGTATATGIRQATYNNGNGSALTGAVSGLYFVDESGVFNKKPLCAAYLVPSTYLSGGQGITGYQMEFAPAYTMFTGDAATGGLSPLQYATGAGMSLSAGGFRASYRADTIFLSRANAGMEDTGSPATAVRMEAHNSRGPNISAYTPSNTGYFGNTAVKLAGTGIYTDSTGGTLTGTRSAILDQSSISFRHQSGRYIAGIEAITSSDSANVYLWDSTASAYQRMFASSIPYWNGKLDSSAIECDTASVITAIGGSSIGGGVDSATVSAIASSYAESAASSKQDTLSFAYNTADQISSINGSALAAGSTYSAGEGIDITDDVISVETPVDIVAGPGIVIDNPDGNTLRVSQATNYEVELYYSPQNHNVANDAEFVMSESIWNFSKVLITFDNMEFENRTCTMLIDLEVSDTGTKFFTPYCNGDTPGTVNIPWAEFNINAAGNIQYSNRGLIYGTWTAPAFTTGTSRGYRVKRVVGIHRIQGGS
jgi:hypothetical protein